MIRIQTFAHYQEKLGFDQIEMETPSNGTLASILADPRFANLPNNALFAINQRFSRLDTKLNDGDEIAIMPPVSGG